MSPVTKALIWVGAFVTLALTPLAVLWALDFWFSTERPCTVSTINHACQ